MKLPHIIILILGMALMWYAGYRAGLLEARPTTLVNENQPHVHTHE